MKPQEPDFSQHSRLSQHLSLLELTDEPLPEAITLAEKATLDRMPSRPLRFPQRRRAWYLTSLALVAAAALLIMWPRQETEQPWQIKGQASFTIHVEQDGAIHTLQPGENLQPGSRIKAEVVSPQAALAFWAVLARDRRILNEINWIWDNRLDLKGGEKTSFPGSLQLDGPSEGEMLCVAFCDQAQLGDLADIMQGRGSGRCTRSCVPLRP